MKPFPAWVKARKAATVAAEGTQAAQDDDEKDQLKDRAKDKEKGKDKGKDEPKEKAKEKGKRKEMVQNPRALLSQQLSLSQS